MVSSRSCHLSGWIFSLLVKLWSIPEQLNCEWYNETEKTLVCSNCRVSRGLEGQGRIPYWNRKWLLYLLHTPSKKIPTAKKSIPSPPRNFCLLILWHSWYALNHPSRWIPPNPVAFIRQIIFSDEPRNACNRVSYISQRPDLSRSISGLNRDIYTFMQEIETDLQKYLRSITKLEDLYNFYWLPGCRRFQIPWISFHWLWKWVIF